MDRASHSSVDIEFNNTVGRTNVQIHNSFTPESQKTTIHVNIESYNTPQKKGAYNLKKHGKEPVQEFNSKLFSAREKTRREQQKQTHSMPVQQQARSQTVQPQSLPYYSNNNAAYVHQPVGNPPMYFYSYPAQPYHGLGALQAATGVQVISSYAQTQQQQFQQQNSQPQIQFSKNTPYTNNSLKKNGNLDAILFSDISRSFNSSSSETVSEKNNQTVVPIQQEEMILTLDPAEDAAEMEIIVLKVPKKLTKIITNQLLQNFIKEYLLDINRNKEKVDFQIDRYLKNALGVETIDETEVELFCTDFVRQCAITEREKAVQFHVNILKSFESMCIFNSAQMDYSLPKKYRSKLKDLFVKIESLEDLNPSNMMMKLKGIKNLEIPKEKGRGPARPKPTLNPSGKLEQATMEEQEDVKFILYQCDFCKSKRLPYEGHWELNCNNYKNHTKQKTESTKQPTYHSSVNNQAYIGYYNPMNSALIYLPTSYTTNAINQQYYATSYYDYSAYADYTIPSTTYTNGYTKPEASQLKQTNYTNNKASFPNTQAYHRAYQQQPKYSGRSRQSFKAVKSNTYSSQQRKDHNRKHTHTHTQQRKQNFHQNYNQQSRYQMYRCQECGGIDDRHELRCSLKNQNQV